MSSYRSHIRVIADILRVAREDSVNEGYVKVSVLLRKANLSYARLMSFINELIATGLLEEVSTERGSVYKITRKGLKFLEEFERFERFAKAYGLKI